MAPILRKNIYPTAPHHQHPQLQRQLRQPQPLQRDISPFGPLSDIGLNSTIIIYSHLFSADTPDGTGDHENMNFEPSEFDGIPDSSCQTRFYTARVAETRQYWFQIDSAILFSKDGNYYRNDTMSNEFKTIDNGPTIPVQYG